MPLSEKARVEVYIPDSPAPAYRELLERLEREFTFGFGGSYLSDLGVPIQDQITLIYTDLPYAMSRHLPLLSTYAEEICAAAFAALEKEAILVTVTQVYHPQQDSTSSQR